jgi:hypothetical protein
VPENNIPLPAFERQAAWRLGLGLLVGIGIQLALNRRMASFKFFTSFVSVPSGR